MRLLGTSIRRTADAARRISTRCRRRLSGSNPVGASHGNFPNRARRGREKHHDRTTGVPFLGSSDPPAFRFTLTIDATCLYCIVSIFSSSVVPPKFLTRPVTGISIVCGSWRIRTNALLVLGPQLYLALLCYNPHNKRTNPLFCTQVPFTIRCIRYAHPPLLGGGVIVWWPKTSPTTDASSRHEPELGAPPPRVCSLFRQTWSSPRTCRSCIGRHLLQEYLPRQVQDRGWYSYMGPQHADRGGSGNATSPPTLLHVRILLKAEVLLPCLGHPSSLPSHPHGRACFSFSISPLGRCVLVEILHTLSKPSGSQPCTAHSPVTLPRVWTFQNLNVGSGFTWEEVMGRLGGRGCLRRVPHLVPANVGSHLRTHPHLPWQVTLLRSEAGDNDTRPLLLL